MSHRSAVRSILAGLLASTAAPAGAQVLDVSAALGALDARVTLEHGRVTVLDGKVADTAAAVTTLVARADAAQASTATLDAAVRAQTAAQAAAVARLDVQEAALRAANDAAVTLNRQVAGVGAGLDAAVRANAGAVTALTGRLDATVAVAAAAGAQGELTAQQLAALGQQVSGNSVSIAVVDARSQATAQQVLLLDQRMAGTTGVAANADARADTVVRQVASLGQTVAGNTASIAVVDARSQQASQQVTTLNQQVAVNTTAIAAVNGRVDGYEVRLAATEARDDRQDGQITENAQAVAVLRADADAGRAGLVRQAAASAPVTVAAASGGAAVSFAGTEGERRLTGVAAGVAASDAATLGQVQASAADTLASANAYTDGRMGGMESRALEVSRQVAALGVREARRDMGALAASSNALSALPQAFIPGRGMMGASIGGSRGETAFAAGLSKAFAGEHAPVVRAGAAVDARRGDFSYNASVGFHF